MPSESRELIFPLRGISEGWSFGRQPEGTCPDAQNVVPIDPLDERVRGGQRWGLSKYYAAQHNGSNELQRLSSVALSIIPQSLTDGFTQGDGQLSDTNWYPLELGGGPTPYDISATVPLISGNKIRCAGDDAEDGVAAVRKNFTLALPYAELTAKVVFTIPVSSTASVGFCYKAPTTFPTSIKFHAITRTQDAGGNQYLYVQGGVGYDSYTMTPGSGDWMDPAWWAESRTIKLTIKGNVTQWYADDVLLQTDVIYSTATGSSVGWRIHCSSGNAVVTLDDFTFEETSQSYRDYKLIAVSGGDIYTGRPSETLTLATNGENVVATSGRVGLQPAYGKTYFCDGTATGYRVLDNATDTVSAWTPNTGVLPVGTTDATKACRMITLYRGRIVMAGLQEFPHNWYMSAVGPGTAGVGGIYDWDYGATTSATMAVAGNNTDAGECPDIITCLAPYSDDLMYMGGDHTLWVMTGDPADRGRLDNISEQIGVSGPDAWAFDPYGVFYFFGMGTIWKLIPGGVPEPISRNRLDATFAAIDLVSDTVHLHWDNQRHGLFIFVVPSAEGATTHYYWDQQSDSFWKVVFPDVIGPTTAYPYDGDNPNDNALLLGGWDGYIRQIDASEKDDDGTAINSYVLYPPIAIGGPERNTRINRISSILDTNSDDVTLTTYAEDTIQRVVEATTKRFVHTLSGGRTTILKRVAGNAIMIKLSNETLDKTWAIESLITNVEATGRTRKNQL